MRIFEVRNVLECPFWDGYNSACNHEHGPIDCADLPNNDYTFPDNCPLKDEKSFEDYLEEAK